MRSYVSTLKRWSLLRRQNFLCEEKTEFLYTVYVYKLLIVLCHGMVLAEGCAEAKKGGPIVENMLQYIEYILYDVRAG